MKKIIIKNIIVMLCFSVFVVVLFNEEDSVPVVSTILPTNYQTIVLKDNNNTLVPLEVDLQVSNSVEDEVLQKIELMKCNDFIDYGLYPLFSSDLEVQGIELNNDQLSIDFNSSFLAKDDIDGLDIAESLSYVFCDDTIHQVNVTVNEDVIDYIPNCKIPVSSMHTNLGINNFNCDTNEIYKTVPVTIYQTNMINQTMFYIPETIRVECHEDDYTMQVMSVVNHIVDNDQVYVESVNYLEGVLGVNISNEILSDGEYIEGILFNQLVKSLNSIQSVEVVEIYVDDIQQVEAIDVSIKINNRIEL